LHQGREFNEFGGEQKRSPELKLSPSTRVNCFNLGDGVQAVKANFCSCGCIEKKRGVNQLDDSAGRFCYTGIRTG
jgi:hypothetical protein